MFRAPRFVAFAFALWSLPAGARDAVSIDPKAFASCAREKNDLKRLACFDGMAARLGISPPKSSTSKAKKWTIKKDVSPVDDSVLAVASLPADSPIVVWPNDRLRPTLIFRCQEGSVDFYVNVGTSPHVESDGAASVTLRIDKDAPFDATFSKSTDGDALFAPNPMELAQALRERHALLMRFIPFNTPPVVVTWSLTGASAAVDAVLGACGIYPKVHAVNLKDATGDAAQYDAHRGSLVFEPIVPRLADCYDRAAFTARKPFTGTLALDLTFPNGTVVDRVVVAETSVGHSRVRDCVADELSYLNIDSALLYQKVSLRLHVEFDVTSQGLQ